MILKPPHKESSDIIMVWVHQIGYQFSGWKDFSSIIMDRILHTVKLKFWGSKHFTNHHHKNVPCGSKFWYHYCFIVDGGSGRFSE